MNFVSSKEEEHERLKKIAESQLPPTIIILGYMEHQIDLTAKIVDDLVQVLEGAGLMTDAPDQVKERIQNLRALLDHTSVDFDNISDIMQSYKIPKAIQNKADTRVVQAQYIGAQVKSGIIESE